MKGWIWNRCRRQGNKAQGAETELKQKQHVENEIEKWLMKRDGEFVTLILKYGMNTDLLMNTHWTWTKLYRSPYHYLSVHPRPSLLRPSHPLHHPENECITNINEFITNINECIMHINEGLTMSVSQWILIPYTLTDIIINSLIFITHSLICIPCSLIPTH